MALFKKKKKEPAAGEEPVEKKSDAHYHSSLDYLSTKDLNCPECEKARKHVKLVENEGKVLECPECHYIHLARR